MDGLLIFRIVRNAFDGKSKAYADTVEVEDFAMGYGYAMPYPGSLYALPAFDRPSESVDIG